MPMNVETGARGGGPRAGEGERRFVIEGVAWDDYVKLNDALGVPGLRMWYCEGALELTTTSPLRERLKKTIARLVEMHAFLTGLRLNGYGSATFRADAKERGAEPDERYVVGGPLVDYPEIVLEVVLTSGGVDKLDIHAALGVREVWFYEKGAFHLHELGGGGYTRIERSALVPGLDFGVLARFAQIEDQHEALAGLQDWLRDRAG